MVKIKSWYFVIITLFLLGTSCVKEDETIYYDDDTNQTELPTEIGLVSFYPFQDNANDVFGSNDGVEFNTNYLAETADVSNKFLQLNGVSTYVNLLNTFDYQEKTISLWFKINSISSNLQVIYSSDNPTLEHGLTLLTTKKVGSQIELYFGIGGKIHTEVIVAETWYNATIITNNGNYSDYLNGVLLTSGSYDTSICSSEGELTSVIGCDRYLNGRFFNGLVDNLRVYDRALSEKELAVIYNSKFSF